MRNPLYFMVELFQQPLWVVVWVNALIAANLASLFFLEQPLAQWILGIFLFQAVVMMAMYAVFGFEKILGLAHALWVPLLGYLVVSMSAYSGLFFNYLVLLSVFIIISLVFDVYDVLSYFRQRKNG